MVLITTELTDTLSLIPATKLFDSIAKEVDKVEMNTRASSSPVTLFCNNLLQGNLA